MSEKWFVQVSFYLDAEISQIKVKPWNEMKNSEVVSGSGIGRVGLFTLTLIS